jgi:hypothetical protein
MTRYFIFCTTLSESVCREKIEYVPSKKQIVAFVNSSRFIFHNPVRPVIPLDHHRLSWLNMAASDGSCLGQYAGQAGEQHGP